MVPDVELVWLDERVLTRGAAALAVVLRLQQKRPSIVTTVLEANMSAPFEESAD
jgi:hypothetical protein